MLPGSAPGSDSCPRPTYINQSWRINKFVQILKVYNIGEKIKCFSTNASLSTAKKEKQNNKNLRSPVKIFQLKNKKDQSVGTVSKLCVSLHYN